MAGRSRSHYTAGRNGGRRRRRIMNDGETMEWKCYQLMLQLLLWQLFAFLFCENSCRGCRQTMIRKEKQQKKEKVSVCVCKEEVKTERERERKGRGREVGSNRRGQEEDYRQVKVHEKRERDCKRSDESKKEKCIDRGKRMRRKRESEKNR
uniref:Uncharacterized protein n=1 Tax=Octopus bimaculoides TaxID=37653 RepID=A0A0L8I5A7_OCTBM